MTVTATRPVKRQGASATDAWRQKSPLRRWVEAQGKEMKDIAQKLGVTRQQLYNYLTGYSIPDLERAVTISEMTGIELREWVRWYRLKPRAAQVAHARMRHGDGEGKK